MDTELQEFELQLKAMRPSGLDEDFLARLGGAISGELQTTRADLRPIEAAMAKLEPAALSAGLSERMEEVVVKVPFPVDEKVVLFPRGSAAPEGRKKMSKSWLGAAAVVAIAGALSAMLVSPKANPPKRVVAAAPMVESGTFVPAGFDSGVSDTHDMGVMWSKNQQPMRVVRVTYMDRVEFTNDKGEKATMEVPRVEYLVVPEKID